MYSCICILWNVHIRLDFAGYFEQSNKPSGSIKDGEFLDKSKEHYFSRTS
jgi:hypothetical protein